MMTSSLSPFSSFWMGGFECADHQNAFGNRVNLLEITRHEDFLEQDYDQMLALGCLTVREGICWSRVETTPYHYNWAGVEHMLQVALSKGVQVVWDMCHFGLPDDLTPLHPMFPRRFAALCRAFAYFHKAHADGAALIVTPINEVGFLSWLGGDARGTTPYAVCLGWEVKYRLVKAYIEGIEALKEVDPEVRIMTTEPLVSITCTPRASMADQRLAAERHEHQFQVLDMLCGRMCSELGGRPEYLDLIGVNFYYNNQWVLPKYEYLCWTRRATDRRWIPLHRLLHAVHQRYDRPIILSETSHPLEDRPLWMEMIATECRAALGMGIPLWGVCWYPMVDRPDWDDLNKWHAAGIWGPLDPLADNFQRVVHVPTAQAFICAQRDLEALLHQSQALEDVASSH